jgi:hypothetical protein
MSGQTIWAHLCLGSWSRKNLTVISDLVTVIQERSKKNKRKREVSTAASSSVENAVAKD